MMQGISAGMEPPPPLVSVLTSLMCICLSVWTYASNGASTAALAVSGFALLSMQLLTVNKLKFSMLASSVFGLFYCGARSASQPCRQPAHASVQLCRASLEPHAYMLARHPQATCPASGSSCACCPRPPSPARRCTAGR